MEHATPRYVGNLIDHCPLAMIITKRSWDGFSDTPLNGVGKSKIEKQAFWVTIFGGFSRVDGRKIFHIMECLSTAKYTNFFAQNVDLFHSRPVLERVSANVISCKVFLSTKIH